MTRPRPRQPDPDGPRRAARRWPPSSETRRAARDAATARARRPDPPRAAPCAALAVACADPLPAPDLERTSCSPSSTSTRSGPTSTRRCSTASTSGCAGNFAKLARGGRSEASRELEAVIAEGARPRGRMRARAVYRFFDASARRRTRSHLRRPDGATRRDVHVPAPGAGERALPRRLRAAAVTARRRRRRPRRACSSRRRARASASSPSELKDEGRVPALARAAGAGARDRGGRRGVAAREASATVWGFPDPPEIDDARPLPGDTTAASATRSATPPAPTSSDQATALPPPRPEEIGVAADRGLHDGPRGVRLGARVPPPARRATSPPDPRGRNLVARPGVQT